jgi:uncharacterized protein (TIGR02246 family)
MKLAVLVGVAAAAIATATLARADTRDVEAIRHLESNFAKAVSSGNVDGIMKVYTPGQSLVVFDVVPPRQYVGADAYRKDWQTFVSMLSGPVKFEISDLAITANNDLAYSHSIQHVSGTDSKKQPFDLVVRVTDVYRKTNGNWLIVHEHVSVPVDLETRQPDLSSKP